ncbi:hypothetical protein PN836_008450 [Ningiella sp. W23]|uniref:hypothetical protein n=1 Tax=Ningiella sp. W23 TaxID=3023715 RepID=UPI003756B80A
MDLSIIILAVLFISVLGLFAYCLTEPKGKHTVHARKNHRGIKVNDTNAASITEQTLS